MKSDNGLRKEILESNVEFYYNLYINYDYLRLYILYRNSEGEKKVALGRVLAEKMCDKAFLIDVDFINDFINSLDICALWTLASGCNNKDVKEKAYEKVVKYLDESMKSKKKVYKRKR